MQDTDNPLVKTLVVVPAYNEELALPETLREIRATLPGVKILVVDDGSSDGTADAARSVEGVKALSLPFNSGVGGAMRLGFKYARKHKFENVIQIDADGQHDPRYAAKLLEAAAEPADIVIGARFAGEGSYKARGPRRWAMQVLSFSLSRVTGTKLTDTTSGFRLSGPRAIALFADKYPSEYLGDTVESLVIAARAGLKIRQVPVQMRERRAGTPSHSPLKATLFLFRVTIAVLMAMARPRRRR